MTKLAPHPPLTTFYKDPSRREEYVRDIFDGRVPETIDRAYVSRALSVGFEWILLLGTVGILLATLVADILYSLLNPRIRLASPRKRFV